VANRAVGVRQPIRMKVRLLNAGADEKKEGAHDGKQKTPAHLGRTMLCHVSHLHRRLYAVFVATLRRVEAANCAICAALAAADETSATPESRAEHKEKFPRLMHAFSKKIESLRWQRGLDSVGGWR
jgi:hypothetical protein